MSIKDYLDNIPVHPKPATEAPPNCAVSPGSAQYSREEVLTLKIGELMLHRGFVTSALEKLSKGARPMGKSGMQIAVLADDVRELVRRCEDMHNVAWPNTEVSNAGTKTK